MFALQAFATGMPHMTPEVTNLLGFSYFRKSASGKTSDCPGCRDRKSGILSRECGGQCLYRASPRR
jgi:hypothetical protein